ncbi:MAG: bifunctional hydroxymethylpyrimidine kinase/phosphomethylpyrimidine kinase [Sulfolobus sp.]|nr:bifunctional hydroxymethylpyrimidine kinase/phosphomethylpyrimidine kinase [Sulfolobus sp.]
MRIRPVVMTIAGSDSSGGAGLQADLKTFTSLGVFGTTVITGLTAQNTTGVKKVLEVPVDFVEAQFDAIMEDFDIKFAKTGMLASNKIIEVVKRKILEYGIKLVLDPVMISKAGSPLTTEDITKSLLELARNSIIITPNSYEAERLTGEKITDKESLIKVAKKLTEITGCNAVVKGGERLKGLDIAVVDNDIVELSGKFVDTRNSHGSGDVFSASLTAYLAKGYSLKDSIRMAKDFTANSLIYSLDMGKGVGPVDSFAAIERVYELGQGLIEISNFIELIKEKYTKTLEAYLTADEKGNIGFKSSYGDVISLSDGLSLDDKQLKVNGTLKININNIIADTLKLSNRKVGISLPLSIKISRLIDKHLVQLTESGLNGNGIIKGSFIVITSNDFNQLLELLQKGENNE